jgi:hypothetical protein
MCRPRTNARTSGPARLGAAAAIVATMLLGGCSDIYMDHRDSISFTAGDAVEANKTAQIYDPWPQHSRNVNYAANGQRMQSAVERYRNNLVTPPVSPMALQSGNPSTMAAQTGSQNNGSQNNGSQNNGSQSGGPSNAGAPGGGGSTTTTTTASGQ